MELGQLVSNENQQVRFKTFFNLKMLFTVSPIKGTALLLFQWSTKSLSERKKNSTGMLVACDKLK